MGWTHGHGEWLMKRADRRRRGRPKLNLEDCVKRDMAGEGGAWRTRVRDGGVETWCRGWWRWQ